MSPQEVLIRLVSGDKPSVVDASIFKNLIGQKQARSLLLFYLERFDPTMPFPTLLFTGSQGLGKTFFASLIAKALGRVFISVNCKQIVTQKQFLDYIIDKAMDDKQNTILLDEAHMLSDEITTVLLTALNPNQEYVNYLRYGAASLEWDMRKINVILATTDAYEIFEPLRNRTKEAYFFPYSDEEIYEIIKLYLPDIKLSDRIKAKDLALACRARARNAFLLSQDIDLFVRAKSTNMFTPEDFSKLKTALGIGPLGLVEAEMRLIDAIAKNGPISAANLAMVLMVNETNVRRELEVRPRELGLIESTPKGRVLTESGGAYMRKYRRKT